EEPPELPKGQPDSATQSDPTAQPPSKRRKVFKKGRRHVGDEPRYAPRGRQRRYPHTRRAGGRKERTTLEQRDKAEHADWAFGKKDVIDLSTVMTRANPLNLEGPMGFNKRGGCVMCPY